MITKDTAAAIWTCYREIEAAEKLLDDMERQRQELGVDEFAPTLRDAFGRLRHLQLGVPSGDNCHRLFDVSPCLARSVIQQHINNKRAEMDMLNVLARRELG